MTNIEDLDPRKYIIIKNARVHNLKNLSVAIPRNQLVVITGLSGSGKSSLAFDTLYAEGQRRYVESLSSYARQFIGRMDKPDVDYIKGISPAIAIEQKVNTNNTRSTVGTSTETYDYLKLLFARVGKTFSPISGNRVKRDSVEDVVNYINGFEHGTRVMIFSSLHFKPGRQLSDELNILLQKGFSRIFYRKEVRKIEDVLEEIRAEVHPGTQKGKKGKSGTLQESASPVLILVDRIEVNPADEDTQGRIADSVQTAFFEGEGECIIEKMEHGKRAAHVHTFSNRFELDGISFEEPSTHLFNFNNPFGACKRCEGFGQVIDIDEDLIIPNKGLSIYQGAIACWRGEKMYEWRDKLVLSAMKFDFPIHRPYHDLTKKEKELLWTGNKYFQGLTDFFKFLEKESYKIQYRVMLSRFRGKTICPDCNGTRIRKDASYVKINGMSITDLLLIPVKESHSFFKNIKLNEHDHEVARRLLMEITNRLQFLCDVGLGYLTLNRLSSTLSGGESQRINLATALGSSLVGSMYILDEPSIGLHPRDTQRLIGVLKSLRDMGNSVIVVEHDEEIMRASDMLLDIGPLAGTGGGNLVFQGQVKEMDPLSSSYTAQYLTGQETIPIPLHRRKWNNFIQVEGARENNLKNVNVKFPLNIITVVTGVSGSGKTSLVKKIFYNAVQKITGGHTEHSGKYDKLSGDLSQVRAIEMIDQNPIGKSSRSNPVSYVKAYDDIRMLMSSLPLARTRNYTPSFFSFNVDGGRCEMCEGAGEIIVEMQFMADIHLICETCGGKRFKSELLEVTYQDKNIADVLELTVNDAIDLFSVHAKLHNDEQRIIDKLRPLSEVGLGYIRLGQSSSTLSGGEAQRVKLASYLGKSAGKHDDLFSLLFVFDEPTTGLHFHDIRKLLYAFNALVDKGHSVLIIEHNPEVIKSADWVIDLGPEGGEGGGNILFEGIPENLIKCKGSITGKFLKSKF